MHRQQLELLLTDDPYFRARNTYSTLGYICKYSNVLVLILSSVPLCHFRTYDKCANFVGLSFMLFSPVLFLLFVAFLPVPFFSFSFFNCAVLGCDLLVCTIFFSPAPALSSSNF